MKKENTFLIWLESTFDSFAAYISLLAGVMFNIYGGFLATGMLPKFEPGKWIIGVAISLVLTSLQEKLPKNDLAARHGRKKNLSKRMIASFAYGVSAQDMLGTAFPIVAKWMN